MNQIPLIYPRSLSSDSESLLHLKRLVEYRMPQHRRGFYLWMIIAPLTAPFMIVRTFLVLFQIPMNTQFARF